MGDPLEAIDFWRWSGSGCGCKSSFSLPVTLADVNFFNDILSLTRGRHCSGVITYGILYDIYSVTMGRHCSGIGGVCAPWVGCCSWCTDACCILAMSTVYCVSSSSVVSSCLLLCVHMCVCFLVYLWYRREVNADSSRGNYLLSTSAMFLMCLRLEFRKSIQLIVIFIFIAIFILCLHFFRVKRDYWSTLVETSFVLSTVEYLKAFTAYSFDAWRQLSFVIPAF